MRRNLGGDGLPVALGPADQFHAPGRADVLNVIAATDRSIQQQIAGDHELLGLGGNPGQAQLRRHDPRVHRPAGQSRLLAMLHDAGIEHFGILQGLAHDRGVADAHAVVAQGDRPALKHRADLRQFLALSALGDRSDRKHIGQPHPLGLAQNEFDLPLVIQRRLGIGHAADGREPPRHRRRRAAGDRLLFLVARLAQMHVNVDQPRRDETTRRVDCPIGFAEIGSDRGDLSVADEKLRPPLKLLRGVEDRAVMDQDCGHKCEYNHEGTKITKTDTKKNYN